MEFAGIHIYPYGLVIAAAALACILFAGIVSRKKGLAAHTAEVFACVAIPLCLLIARALYCMIRSNGFGIYGAGYFFQFTHGGYMLWGAVIGFVCALLLTARMTGQSALRIADCMAAPAALLLAISRLAELLVGEGYGWYVEDWFDPWMGMSLFHPEDCSFFQRLPFAMRDMYGEWSWAICVLEALLALACCIWLLCIRFNSDGLQGISALLMLSALQVLCVSLRQDAVIRFGFVRISQLIGAVVIAAIHAYACIRLPQKHVRTILLPTAVVAASIGICVAMEFALEKRIVFMENVPMDVCYCITAASCLMMTLTVMTLLRKGEQAR